MILSVAQRKALFAANPLIGGRSLAALLDNNRGKDACQTSSGTITTGGANTKGSWVGVIDPTSEDCYALSIMIPNTTVVRDYLIDIGIGGAGAEVAVVANLLHTSTNAGQVGSQLIVPLFIKKGARVSTRGQCNVATQNLQIHVTTLTRKQYLEQPLTCDTYGAATGDSGGVSVDPGATINTKGAWSELTASASRRITQLCVRIGGQANTTRAVNQWAWDIGIGGAGSEVVLIPDLFLYCHTTNDIPTPDVWGPFPVEIPAGTRIAARCQCTINDAADRLIDVVAYALSPEK